MGRTSAYEAFLRALLHEFCDLSFDYLGDISAYLFSSWLSSELNLPHKPFHIILQFKLCFSVTSDSLVNRVNKS